MNQIIEVIAELNKTDFFSPEAAVLRRQLVKLMVKEIDHGSIDDPGLISDRDHRKFNHADIRYLQKNQNPIRWLRDQKKSEIVSKI
jgi:hypothetical protein